MRMSVRGQVRTAVWLAVLGASGLVHAATWHVAGGGDDVYFLLPPEGALSFADWDVAGGGAYCIMGGWVMGYVPMALMEGD